MSSYWRPAITLLALLSLLTGAIYPAAITWIAQSWFSEPANGSLIKDQQGRIIGSALIGQSFSDAAHFWSRPSATQPDPYNAAASGGSNLGPSNPALKRAVESRIQDLHKLDPDNPLPIPVDLVTASASGLDPHISLAAVEYQLHRVAKARNISENQLREWVAVQTEGRQWGVFGEPRVNVLKLNLALDRLAAFESPSVHSEQVP